MNAEFEDTSYQRPFKTISGLIEANSALDPQYVLIPVQSTVDTFIFVMASCHH